MRPPGPKDASEGGAPCSGGQIVHPALVQQRHAKRPLRRSQRRWRGARRRIVGRHTRCATGGAIVKGRRRGRGTEWRNGVLCCGTLLRESRGHWGLGAGAETRRRDSPDGRAGARAEEAAWVGVGVDDGVRDMARHRVRVRAGVKDEARVRIRVRAELGVTGRAEVEAGVKAWARAAVGARVWVRQGGEG